MEIFEGYIYPLTERYQSQRNVVYAQAISQYMRNQFDFFGIKHPKRRILDKQFILEYGLPEKADLERILSELWQQTEREFQYFAIDLAASCNYYRQESSLDLIEKKIIQRSWWDTVDAVSSALVAPYFRYFPEKIHDIAYQWIASENIWLQRVAITFQRKYKKLTDKKLLFNLIRLRADSKEFFIQKGIGWALREYAYTNPEEVRDFVTTQSMSNLSKREALKHIGKNN